MARRVHSPRSEYTILVVDDQEETLLSVRQMLQREGHRVLTAATAAQALTLFKEHDVHLLVVDYFMPRTNGEQLIREIRSFDPFVQIILQTACAEEKPPRQVLADLDIQGYHSKTDGPEMLLLWVDAGLKAYRVVRRLRERERMQAELVASVSHELRTPLCVINGYSELLRDGAFGVLPSTTTPPLEAVEKATRGLDALFSSFLQYAKLEAGVLEVSRQWVTIDELIDDLPRAVALQLLTRDVTFSIDVDGPVDGLVTDHGKLLLILRGLLANATKFTTAGSVTLRISPHGDRLHFVVCDTGPGIRPEDINRIFEPFCQVDGSSTRQHSGIGLGLALSRKLAHLLGGGIGVDSVVGVGSTFTLWLPGFAVEDQSAYRQATASQRRQRLPRAMGARRANA